MTFTKEQLIEIAQENVNTLAAAMETDNLAQKEYAAIRLRVAEIALSELVRPKSQSTPVRYLNKFSGACVTLEWQPNAATDLAVYQPLYAEMPLPLATSERAELHEYRNGDASIFPGVMRCPVCDFSRTYINVTPSGNYAGESVPERCPNGCGPLWHDTYKRQYNDLYDHAEELRAEIENYRNAQQVVPDGLRLALSNAGIAAPESDEVLFARHENYVQMLVTWVKDRNPFQPARVVPDEIDENDPALDTHRKWMAEGWNRCRAAMQSGAGLKGGWVMVPVDATPAMIDAAARVEEDGFDAMHKAMLAAVPQQYSDKSPKPVADLYAIKVPGCRSLNYTTHAGEAESCASEGWLVQEYVKVERLQRTADNGGDSYVLMDGLAFYPDKE